MNSNDNSNFILQPSFCELKHLNPNILNHSDVPASWAYHPEDSTCSIGQTILPGFCLQNYCTLLSRLMSAEVTLTKWPFLRHKRSFSSKGCMVFSSELFLSSQLSQDPTQYILACIHPRTILRSIFLTDSGLLSH